MRIEIEKIRRHEEAHTQIAGKSCRGSYIVEFSLIVPVFVLLLTGMMDLGRGYFQTHVLLDAAQAGARVGSLPSSTTTQVSTAVHAVLDPAKITGAQITSSNIGGAGARGSTTSVVVTAPFTTLSGTVLPGWSGTINLSQAVNLRHE